MRSRQIRQREKAIRHKLRMKAAVNLQRNWHSFWLRRWLCRSVAATKIQCAVRCWIARNLYKKIFHIKHGPSFRRYIRKIIEDLTPRVASKLWWKRRKAILLIQAKTRKWLVKLRERKRKERIAKRNQGATDIQRIWKGWKARRRKKLLIVYRERRKTNIFRDKKSTSQVLKSVLETAKTLWSSVDPLAGSRFVYVLRLLGLHGFEEELAKIKVTELEHLGVMDKANLEELMPDSRDRAALLGAFRRDPKVLLSMRLVNQDDIYNMFLSLWPEKKSRATNFSTTVAAVNYVSRASLSRFLTNCKGSDADAKNNVKLYVLDWKHMEAEKEYNKNRLQTASALYADAVDWCAELIWEGFLCNEALKAYSEAERETGLEIKAEILFDHLWSLNKCDTAAIRIQALRRGVYGRRTFKRIKHQAWKDRNINKYKDEQ
jgi:hypothetical protein